MTVSLRELSALVTGSRVQGDDTVRVSGVNSDSRGVAPGDLFAAVVGGTTMHRALRQRPSSVVPRRCSLLVLSI